MKKKLLNQKYQTSHISQQKLHQIWWQLHDALESNPQFWQEPTSLKVFCDLFQTNQKYFSQTVNQATGSNIIALLHCYRIEFFLKKLADGEVKMKTIEGLAFESGFKNRSSFYTALRKIIGAKVTEIIAQSKVKMQERPCP